MVLISSDRSNRARRAGMICSDMDDSISANPAGSGFESLAAHKPQVDPASTGAGHLSGTVYGRLSRRVPLHSLRTLTDFAVTLAVYAHGILATLAGTIRRCLQGGAR